MAKDEETFVDLLVETFVDPLTRRVRVRPLPGQGYRTDLFVECGKKMRKDYPVGTKFRIRAKYTDREGGGEFFYAHHSWKFEKIED